MSIRLHIVCIACLSMLVVAVMMHLNPAGTSPEIAGRLNAYRRVEQAATIIRNSVSNEVFQIKSCGWIYDELEKNGVHNARKYISICTLGTCFALVVRISAVQSDISRKKSCLWTDAESGKVEFGIVRTREMA